MANVLDSNLPKPQKLVLDQDRLLMEDARQRRTLRLQDYPVVWACVESIRATLAGDLKALLGFYKVELHGGEDEWRLSLRPSEPSLLSMVSEIRISGQRERVRTIEVVEGEGDQRSLQLVAERSGRPELLADIHIQPAGGTKRIVAQAIVAKAAAKGKPVLVLLDNDEPGRLARKDLKEKFQFQNNRELLSYADVFPKHQQDFPYEAEDLFPPELLEDFVTEHGNSVVDGTKRRPDGAFHYDLGASSKELLGTHLAASLTPAHLDLWLALIERIRKELGLSEVAPSLPNVAERRSPVPRATPRHQGELVLVLGDQSASARYQESSACVLDPTRPVAPEVTHVGFYVDGVIREAVPLIKGRYGSLRFDDETVNSLSKTTKETDRRAAELIREWVSEENYPYGSVHQLLLLSPPQSEETLRLSQPVENTKVTTKGRPMAWLIGQRTTTYAALAQNPTTTDELEQLGG